MQQWYKVLVPSDKICIQNFVSSSAELRPPPRWRMVTSSWAQDFWSSLLTPPPIYPKKVTHPEALSQILPLKTSLPNYWEFEPPILFAWPSNKSSFALNSNILVCLASLGIGQSNLHLVTLLLVEESLYLAKDTVDSQPCVLLESTGSLKIHVYVCICVCVCVCVWAYAHSPPLKILVRLMNQQ